MTSDEFSDIEQLDENLRKWFKEKWVRFGPDGKIRGACARGDDSEGKPKCLPQKKAQNLGKKGRKYAASKKRREDPNPERTGKAKNVATKKKTNEGVPFDECPKCRGPIVHESMMTEKQDACYHKVKSRYKVWPSAYASGALVQCRKKGASNWGTGGKKNENNVVKGMVNEEYVLTLYIDGKPSSKYGIDQEARQAMERLKKKFPDRHFELKREVRGGIGGNEKIKEGVIIGHDKDDPQVAVLGGAGSYKLSNLKKKALGEAKQLAADIANGEYKNSAYNVKQLANTLNTIVAAEDEMEKLYFGEAVDWQRGEYNNEHDHTFSDAEKYLAHLYPVVKKYMIRRAEVGFRAVKNMNYLSSKNPMDHLDDKQFLNSKAHINNVDAAINYLGLVKLPMMSGSKQATSSIGYTWTTFLSPNKKAAVMYVQDRGMGQDMIYIAAVDKTLHRKIYDLFVDAGVIVGRDKKLQEPELPDAMRVSNATNRDEAFKKAMDKFYNKTDDKDVNEDYTGEFAAEVTPAINPYGGLKDKKFRGAIGEALLSEMPDTSGPIGVQPGGWRTYKPRPAGEIDEDTAYAGGGGQGGNAGESYRKFKPKSAGTFKEDEQLDELKCWSGYTRVKGVPAGAPGSCKKKTKESSILKGLRSKD